MVDGGWCMLLTEQSEMIYLIYYQSISPFLVEVYKRAVSSDRGRTRKLPGERACIGVEYIYFKFHGSNCEFVLKLKRQPVLAMRSKGFHVTVVVVLVAMATCLCLVGFVVVEFDPQPQGIVQ